MLHVKNIKIHPLSEEAALNKVKAYGWLLLVGYMLVPALLPVIAAQEVVVSSAAQQPSSSTPTDLASNKSADDKGIPRAESFSAQPEHQPTRLAVPAEGKELSTFFKIGMAINLIMLAVYFIWAVRQWRQTKK